MMLKKIENLTQAEEAILAASTLLGPDKERTAAADTLRAHGLPTRRVESWHYTDLRNQLKAFPENTQSASKKQADEWLDNCSEFLPALRLAFLNGVFLEGPTEVLPAGLNLQTGLANGGYRDATDAVALINSMLAVDGVKISIDAGAAINEPVELLHGVTGDSASACRHSITLGAGASASFIERHISESSQPAFSNTVTDLSLEKGANVRWIIVQEEGEHTNHLGQLNVTLGEDARLEILILNAGGALVRREINVAVLGPNSDLSIRGVNLIGEGAHIDVTTSLLHEAPDTISNEIFRNVATGNGKGVFQGEIRVAKDAQKTDARMACNTLLLSDEAEYSAKPELEIFADDVQCAHGATVTDILDDHLFYLRARGLSERDARALLVKAFVEEVFDEIEEDDLRDKLNARIENWLDNHG
ncbi:MAG: Fe-S cluster assembly protein SufD [Pseudomonadota bacterium]